MQSKGFKPVSNGVASQMDVGQLVGLTEAYMSQQTELLKVALPIVVGKFQEIEGEEDAEEIGRLAALVVQSALAVLQPQQQPAPDDETLSKLLKKEALEQQLHAIKAQLGDIGAGSV